MDKREFQEIIVNSTIAVLSLLVNGVIVGQVMYDQHSEELCNLFVDIKYRGKGYAKDLLKESMFRYSPKYITASNCYGSDVADLVKLYSSVGFTVNTIRMERTF